MSDIQRWTTLQIMGLGTAGDPNAGWYAEDDHVEALRQAVEEAHSGCESTIAGAYEQGQRDMLAHCVAAVEAMPISPQDWDYTSRQSYGDIRHEAWQEALTALRALGGSDE